MTACADASGTLPPRLARLERALIAAARSNQACPSNDEVARLVGMTSRSKGSEAMRELEQLGLIKVERFAASRRVTIVATGEQTLVDGDRAPHWRACETRPAKPNTRPVTIKADRSADRPEPIAAREACWRCGVRGDVGCEHQPFGSQVRRSDRTLGGVGSGML